MPDWVRFAILQRVTGKYIFGPLMKDSLMRPINQCGRWGDSRDGRRGDGCRGVRG